jgi:hypothetical protein
MNNVVNFLSKTEALAAGLSFSKAIKLFHRLIEKSGPNNLFF